MASNNGYTFEQLQKLEELFMECKFPNRDLREKWSRDLGINPDQIKSWFKNKILLLEIEEKREENDALRRENAKIQTENIIMRNKLENRPKCRTCLRNEGLQDLLLENAKLREEHERVTKIAVGILRDPTLLQLRGLRKRCRDDEENQGVGVDLELRLAPTLDENIEELGNKYHKD